jgi:hypothetical protein
MATGSCLCGEIKYSVSIALGFVTGCHCTQCRKSTGHFAAAVPAPWEAVSVTGDPRWYESSAQGRRGFCATCGSYLFWEEGDGIVYLQAGCLDGATGLRMDGHIFYGDKGDYYNVGEGLACWEAGRDSPQVSP